MLAPVYQEPFIIRAIRSSVQGVEVEYEHSCQQRFRSGSLLGEPLFYSEFSKKLTQAVGGNN